MEKLVINLERLMNMFKVSNRIGGVSGTGLCRLALSTEDQLMRDVFVTWLKEEGLEVRVDDFGNIYGRREGKRNDLAPVMMGSHLDSQPYGGRYDGILGVLGALEVIKVLNENNVETLRPIEIVNFTNEEGARFIPPMLGSGGITNIFTKDFVYGSKDGNGYRFENELKKIGYLGDKKNRPKKIHSFIELHIEQGPILEQRNKSIGVVEGVNGSTWLEVTVKGDAGHAGSTPMDVRRDALVKAAEIIVAIKDLVNGFNSTGTVTIGKLHIEPGSINCIPGKVTFNIDIRHKDDNMRNHLVEVIKERSAALTLINDMTIEIKSLWDSPSVFFNKSIIREIESTAHGLGYSTLKMMSGASHDAKYMQKIVPTAMIFVPSKGGRSHCIEEFTSEKEIEKGATVLLNSVINLAQQETSPTTADSN